MTDQKINIAIAEKVMSWRVHRSKAKELLCDGMTPNGDIFVNAKLPDFATNIADAWIIAENMELTVTPGHHGWRAAYCNWSQVGETTAVGMTNHQRWTVAETAPRAICLAALRLRGIKVKP